MSNTAQSWAWKQQPKHASDKAVLVALADNAWEDGSNAWPSVKLLADKTGLSERTVQRSLQRLLANGYVSVQQEAHPKVARPTTYKMDLSRPDEIVSPGARTSPPDVASPGDTVSPPDIDACHQVTMSAAPGDTVTPEPLKNPQKEPSKTSSAPKRGTRAPESFVVTAELRAWAKAQGITVNLDEETEQFLDHHRGKGTVGKDWTAYWRTWMRNTKKFGRPAGRPPIHQPYLNPQDESVYDQPLEATR